MVGLSRWLCSSSTAKMVLKIVHPGGRVELHEHPILAAEIMYRNPRCCVAHPTVFQQPWAVVEPETLLMLGQKFYLVPISTIRKLQRASLKPSSSSTPPLRLASPLPYEETKQVEKERPNCCDFPISNSERPSGNYSNGSCFTCLFRGKELFPVDYTCLENGCIKEKGSNKRKTVKENSRKVVRVYSPVVQWQPGLEGINEETPL
ncbi:hypothetical protein AMTRI_Chr05g70260 [Amborella trichopoda]